MKKLVNLDQLRQVQTRVKAYALDLVSKLADATTQAVAETQASVTVFTATFRLDGWTKSGSTWTQTAACTGMQAGYNTSSPWTCKTGNQATDAALQDALSQLNDGLLQPLNGQLKATLYAPPPGCDVKIFVRRAI